MRMVIGGKAQGKLTYVLSHENLLQDEIIDGRTCPLQAPFRGKALYALHELVRRVLKDGNDPREVVVSILRENAELIIITDEIGGGIVPMEPFERQWREEYGKICCMLAKKAQKVERVYCGIPMVIKE